MTKSWRFNYDQLATYSSICLFLPAIYLRFTRNLIDISVAVLIIWEQFWLNNNVVVVYIEFIWKFTVIDKDFSGCLTRGVHLKLHVFDIISSCLPTIILDVVLQKRKQS
jgi:hypothetical protein